MRKVEKQVTPVVIDDDEPKAIIFWNKNRDRVIYMTVKASEEEMMELIENPEKKIDVI